jgi:hypothetical protein
MKVSYIFSYIYENKLKFWWDDDDVHFILEQYA